MRSKTPPRKCRRYSGFAHHASLRHRFLAEYRLSRDQEPDQPEYDHQCRSEQRQRLADGQGNSDRVRRSRRMRHYPVSGAQRRPLRLQPLGRSRFERQHLSCRNDHRPAHPEVRSGEIRPRLLEALKPCLRWPRIAASWQLPPIEEFPPMLKRWISWVGAWLFCATFGLLRQALMICRSIG